MIPPIAAAPIISIGMNSPNPFVRFVSGLRIVFDRSFSALNGFAPPGINPDAPPPLNGFKCIPPDVGIT